MRRSEHLISSPIMAQGSISAGTLGSRGEMAGFGLVRLPLGSLRGGSGGVQLAHQPVTFGFQTRAVLGSSAVQLRSADVEGSGGIPSVRRQAVSRASDECWAIPFAQSKAQEVPCWGSA